MARILLPGLLAGCAATAAPPAACGDCSIVWITVDTLRADRVGVYGGPAGATPRLDALAARGTRVGRALAEGPLTILSVPAYLSGRHRFDTGMGFNFRDNTYDRLPDTIVTLPEALRDAGFRTAGFVSNPVLGYTTAHTGARWDADPYHLSVGFEEWTYYADDAVIAGQAAAWWADPRPGRRFLYVHLMGPHDPNAEGEGFAERHGTFPSAYAKARRVTFDDYVPVRQNRRLPTASDIAYVSALYDDAVTEADALVGKVLDAVAAGPHPDRTLVVFTSDHGEALGEKFDGHPWFGHGHNLRDELLHVPLVFAGPGVPAGVVDATSVVEHVDIAPTLLDLAAVPRDPAWGWTGDAYLGPRAKPAAFALSERDDEGETIGAASDGRYRVLVTKSTGAVRRYDVLADPLERSPIAANPATEALVEARRAAWAAARPPASDSFTPDDAMIEKLRAMGYVE